MSKTFSFGVYHFDTFVLKKWLLWNPLCVEGGLMFMNFVGHRYSPRANIKLSWEQLMYQNAEKFLLPINIDPCKNHNDLTLVK